MRSAREHDGSRYDSYILPKPDAGVAKSVVVANKTYDPYQV